MLCSAKIMNAHLTLFPSQCGSYTDGKQPLQWQFKVETGSLDLKNTPQIKKRKSAGKSDDSLAMQSANSPGMQTGHL